MPLIPAVMQGLIQQKALLKQMTGSKLSPLVSAISSATCLYLLSFSVVNSTNNVLGPGAGSQVGRLIGLSPSDMASKMSAYAKSQGLSGRDSDKVFSAMSFGVVNALNTVIVQGAVIGGGPGVGFGKIMGLVPAGLTGFLMQQESLRLMAGTKMMGLMSSISFGICIHIMTMGTVNITNIGAAAPPPVGPVPVPTAPGIGRFY